MGSPYAIGGDISFGSAPSLMNPMAGYEQAYNNALQINQQNYSNIIAGYQKLAATQFDAQGPITAGYGSLYNNVLGTICGICQSQQHAVQATYTKQMGATQNRLIGAGLGNSTILQSAARGVTADAANAQTAVKNQFAQLKAGYMSQLGLAGLNWQAQAMNANTALGVDQLRTMANIQAPYPNAGAYMNAMQGQMGMRGTPTPNGPMGGGAGGVQGLGSGGRQISGSPGTPYDSGTPFGGGSNIYGTGICRPANQGLNAQIQAENSRLMSNATFQNTWNPWQKLTECANNQLWNQTGPYNPNPDQDPNPAGAVGGVGTGCGVNYDGNYGGYCGYNDAGCYGYYGGGGCFGGCYGYSC